MRCITAIPARPSSFFFHKSRGVHVRRVVVPAPSTPFVPKRYTWQVNKISHTSTLKPPAKRRKREGKGEEKKD
jgi:hypothetical protein